VRSGLLGGSIAVVAAVLTAAPAGAAQTLKPRAGHYAGQEAYGTTPLPVSFTVTRSRTRVTKFTAQAEVRGRCSNHITSFQAPTGPMRIDANGRFAARSTNYPQSGVRVRVSGVFTSRAKVRGRISVHIAGQKDCDASRSFHAQRSPTPTS
jgi:hypothetical protein